MPVTTGVREVFIDSAADKNALEGRVPRTLSCRTIPQIRTNNFQKLPDPGRKILFRVHSPCNPVHSWPFFKIRWCGCSHQPSWVTEAKDADYAPRSLVIFIDARRTATISLTAV